MFGATEEELQDSLQSLTEEYIIKYNIITKVIVISRKDKKINIIICDGK